MTHSWSYGDYTVLLTTTNAYGWVETDTLALDVGHVPVASFLSNSPVNLGQNAVFTDTTTYEPTSWSWDFGDAVGTSNEPDPIYNYSNPGIYTVTLTVGNYCGTDVYADVFAVNYPVYLPLVTNDYNGIQCETHAASLTLSATPTTLTVGQAVTVTATLANEGCGMLGVPLYSLDVQSSEAQPIFDPMDPEPVLHHVGIGLGDSDSAEFVMQTLAPGQATLYGSVSYEVHLGFPGPAYWSGSSAGPLVITVTP